MSNHLHIDVVAGNGTITKLKNLFECADKQVGELFAMPMTYQNIVDIDIHKMFNFNKETISIIIINDIDHFDKDSLIFDAINNLEAENCIFIQTHIKEMT